MQIFSAVPVGYAIAAGQLNRNWICCDMGNLAMGVSQKRLAKEKANYSYLEESAEALKVGVDFQAIAEALDGDLTAVSLTEYVVDIEQLPISKDEKDKLIVTDKLQMVDYWSVDLNYDGQIHNSQIVFVKGEGRIEKSTVTDLPVFKEISIRVIDVFGNAIKEKHIEVCSKRIRAFILV